MATMKLNFTLFFNPAPQKTNPSEPLKQNTIEPYPSSQKVSINPMKFLFVIVFPFAIMQLGTKAVPTGETPSIDRSQKYACHGRPLPSAARPQKPIYAIDWPSFSYLWLEINTLFSVLLLSDTLCSSIGKKGPCRTQDPLE